MLFYLGRRDFQTKVSGYRVELQEIDLVLREAAGTELAVAIPWPVSDGTASGIVGVLSGSSSIHDEHIIAACERRLPRYMVPTRLCHFQEMPLNVNGKIDRGRISEMLAKESSREGPPWPVSPGFSPQTIPDSAGQSTRP